MAESRKYLAGERILIVIVMQVTLLLNNYFGGLINLIHDHGGDIVKVDLEFFFLCNVVLIIPNSSLAMR